MRIFYLVVLVLLLILTVQSLPAGADNTIPVEDFFKKPAYGGRPILSPDGKNLAVLTPRNGKFVLAVIDLETRQPKVIASDPDWNITAPMWVNNERLIFSITRGVDSVMEDNKGGGLFAVNRDGSSFRKLVVTRKEAESGTVPYRPVRVIGRVANDSNELFVVNNERGRDTELGASDVFRMDTTNGRMRLLTFDNPGKVSSWVLDHAQSIRIAQAISVDTQSKRIKQTVFYRDNEKTVWRIIYSAYADEGTLISVLGFAFDNKTMFVSGRFKGRDKESIHIWDFSKNEAGEVIADHPEVDIADGLEFDIDRKKLIGVAVNGLKPEMYFFDKDYANIQVALNASFPGQTVNFQWHGKRAVVMTSGIHNVGKAYLYDTEKKVLEYLYTVKPELEGKRLSEQTVIRYAARDGLQIPAYLTLPEGREPKKLPLVAYIHGGPHSRDRYGYDPMTQMLASRGYAVFQPQFRMSTGFGWKHHTAGWKQWGLAMQDDVTDGIESLIKQGIVDRNRVCIIGASYGGYATMYGLVKDPDFYKCGVNWVGVTDVKLLFTVSWSDTQGPFMENMGTFMHGNPKTDEAYFQKVSAIENAHRIKAPVLMAYGSEDIRVPLIHGEKMRDKLIKQGNMVDWMVMTGEGHGWAKESNNILWGKTVLNFIDKHIGSAPTSMVAK